MKRTYSGTTVPIPTPILPDETLDEEAYRILVEYMIKNGVHGIFSCGTLGETMQLTQDQRTRAIKVAVDQAKGRMEMMEQFVALVEENAETIAQIMTAEGGKPIGQSRGEVGRVKDTVRAYVSQARTLYGKTLPQNPEPRGEGDISFTIYEPLGVVAAIPAFNFPAVVYAHKIAAALCAGNAVIMKPASDTPCSAIFMTELLLKAGIPVKETLAGRIANAGQVCCSSKRMIVQNTIREEYTKKLAAAIEALKIGDPSDPSVQVGPVINPRAAEHIMAQVDNAVKQGAKLVTGGIRKDNFITPVVLGDVPVTADVANNDEIFGPVFPVIGFDTPEEAVAICNQSCYGLSAGILTNNMHLGVNMATKIDAGGVVVGGNGNYRLSQQPFGGHKMSGVGTEGAMFTLTELMKIKTIVLKNVLK